MFVRFDDLDDDAHDDAMDRVNDALSDANEVIIDYCNQQHPVIKSTPKDLMKKGDKKCK